MIKLEHITFACDDPDNLAAFWAAALDLERRGLPPSADSVILDRPAGPDLLFNELPCESHEDLPVHLDFAVDDREVAERRLGDLGATVRERRSESFEDAIHRWTVMEDPAGNGFCITEY